jgi:hypothetical protein
LEASGDDKQVAFNSRGSVGQVTMQQDFAPVLENGGGLAAVKNFATAKGYLHFQYLNKTLGNGTGFWVNKP